MLRKPLWSLTATVSLLACNGGTDPSIKPCPGGGGVPVTLALFEYVSLDVGADEGCAMFPATGGSPAEYLVVPQLATGTPGQKTAFQLGGDTIRPIVLAPPVTRTSVAAPSGISWVSETPWRSALKKSFRNGLYSRPKVTYSASVMPE